MQEKDAPLKLICHVDASYLAHSDAKSQVTLVTACLLKTLDHSIPSHPNKSW
jgi:hypothetical protein